ncbi:glutamine cyclotransferase [Mycolicibacterium iranicum]|uniref:Glutamine cyclotransferase n=1 Tax=Mycolicibacterium iranicum TaxID=912594 RepID=A0A839Q7P5_MYCIR|nr:glutaminyl-peptide cyclotransferase [Mycolicibacterium iranicum]MBB2989242.1 glutamine cyclotransferase [Mycolicibacterium iranicum]
MTPSWQRAAPRIGAVLALAVVAGCASPPVAQAGPAPVIEPVVLEEIPHDPQAFTQGFEIHDGILYEGTGLEGESQLRELDPDTGRVLRAVAVPTQYFGEGITVVDSRIWQLTWQNGMAIEWDRASLSTTRELPIPPEGWGLCYDGRRLIRSDGTDRLTFNDPSELAETGSVSVTRNGEKVTGLNELECVDGQVWANVWPSNEIVRIDPGTGVVGLVVDASSLRARGIPPSAQVLNGIAHVRGSEFLLTGKYWPKTFRVQLADS